MMPLLGLVRTTSKQVAFVPTSLLLVLLLLLTGTILVTAEDLTASEAKLRDLGLLQEEDEGVETPLAETQDGPELLDEEGDERDKRVPSAFMGLRGKKAPSGFMGLRGRRGEEQLQVAPHWAPLGDADPQKRVPYGFVGMRGKKAPSGFVGMRGKKAPSAFLGMRGKKEVPRSLNDLLLALSSRYRNNYGSKRAPLGFLGLRGRRAGYSSEGEAVPEDGIDYTMDEVDKRAPYGFVGMRG